LQDYCNCHGHTDEIGEAVRDKIYLLARANDVKKIVENGLSETGKK
jgi:hypothetical protein